MAWEQYEIEVTVAVEAETQAQALKILGDSLAESFGETARIEGVRRRTQRTWR